MKKLVILLGLMLVFIAACTSSDEPEPLIVFITATPDMDSSTATTVNEVAAQPTDPPPFPSATPSQTLENPPSITPTFTATPVTPTLAAFPSATASVTPTVTPTIEGQPSITMSPTPDPEEEQQPVVVAPPTEPGELPGFPTATPSATPDVTVPPELEGAEIVYPPAVSGLAPAPEELPIINVGNLGMQLHPYVSAEDWRTAIGRTRELGITWLKIQVPWEQVEPSPGQFSPDYQLVVDLVRRSHLNGFKVLISVNRAPEWARPADADLGEHGPPEDPQALANFITRLMSDIEPQFMEAIEIWNEPNLLREWQGVPMDGGTYMQYFAPAYEAAKAVDPDAVVITAGLAPVGDIGSSTRNDRDFLQEMYDAGLANFEDARIGVHPYGWGNPPDARCCQDASWSDASQFFYLDTLDDYRDIMVANGDADGKMWLTEFGWGTYEAINADGSDGVTPPQAGFFDLVTPLEQAEYLLRAIEIHQSAPYNEFVEFAFIWNMNFASLPFAIEEQAEQAGYSLLNSAAQPRPVFWYLLNTRKIY